MRLLSLDNGSGGNMDRSLSAAAVAPVPATFTTQVSSSSITLGQSVTDLATLAGPNGTVSGSVAFFVCGPSLVSNPDCSTGGSAVGSAVTLSGGTATSPAYAPTQAGRYCFRAQYSPDLFAQYSPGNHTNLTTECFEVVLPLGTLRVIKQVVNDNGGTKGAGDFNLHVKSGGTDVAGSPAAGSATGTVYTLASGTYVVSEDAPPAGYAQTGISGDCAADGTVTVAAGMQKTCTIKNDDISPKLIVIKHVVNDEAGTSTAANFTMSVTGSFAQPGELRRRRGARHAGSDPPRRVQRLGDRPVRLHRRVLGRLQRLDRARRDEDLHGHEQRQRHAELDPRHEDGGSDLASGAGRQRLVLGVGQEHVGRRLGLDHEPDR